MATFSLALSGGGILGAAHLGALDALYAAGLVPDAFAGTSSGGLVAGFLAAGGRLSDLLKFGRTVAAHPARYFGVNVHGLLDELLPALGPRPTGLITPAGFINGLTSLVPAVTKTAQWSVPAAVISVDLVREEAAVFTAGAPGRKPFGRWRVIGDGTLADALTATMAMPGLFDGVRLPDAVLVDGGVADTLPADWAYALCPGPVLAINVTPSRTMAPAEIGIVETLSRSEQYLTSLVSTLRSRHLPILTVAPDTSGFPFLAFKDFATLVDIGRRAIQSRLPEIRRFIGQSA